ncbi:MAG: DUF3095 domain-containing protein [Oligoflexia bacterium]|nr:DUF3095 domain-containing protein [Oligoflexia bacterium]
MDTFYSQLKPFTEFSQVSNVNHYTEAPRDWFVLITDVRNSTIAIENGRYQDVNMAGAATIAAALNVMNRTEIPFVFGGDGATILFPPEYLETLRQELVKTQSLIKESFDLEMRIGIVPNKDLDQTKYAIRVAKYQLAPGNCLAMFQGGGLQRAEKLVKEDRSDRYIIAKPFQDDDQRPNLGGLSCRWTPLPSKKGNILTLLVLAHSTGSETEIYSRVLNEISRICNARIRDLAPMQDQKPILRLSFRKIFSEALISKSEKPLPVRLINAAAIHLFLKLAFLANIKIGNFVPKSYLNELTQNLDSRKFDDMLRLVLDCTNDQSEKIKRYLDELYIKKEIFWGSHETNRALMTCLVFSPGQNQHVHFVDGADGGYALAAKQLKEQMRSTNFIK